MKRFLPILFSVLVSSCGGCKDPDPPPTCTTDQDCRMGERCTMEGLCVAGAECVNDQECASIDPRRQCNLETFTCDLREGFGDECDATRPCPFGKFCSSLLGLCLDSGTSRDCTRRAQCPTNQICDRAANKCIPDPGCYGDQFCETGEICDLVSHDCRTLAVECTSCILTGSCEGGLLCFVDTKECLASAQDSACGEGETCDPLGRCVQCTNSDQCGPGLFCNVAIGRCESNVQCADDPSLCPDTPEVTCVMCESPEICDPRTKRCQAPPMICESDIDCPNEQVCDLSVDPHLCTPRIPDCLNDLLEGDRDNDTIATAALLDPAVNDFPELKVCPGDVDWYRIDAAPGTYLTIDARFEQIDGDIDMQLFLPDGRTLVDESRSVTDNERVEIEVGTQLTLFLRVFLAIPTVRDVPYRLVVARDPGAVCMDDTNEPDDGQIEAKQLLSDAPYEGRLCSADPDWFVLRNVAPETRIHATLDFVDNLGDLELELYRAGQAVPQLVANSNDDDEELTFDASFGGDFFLRVVGKGTDTNVYTIRVELREGEGTACLDDPFEPNETPLTATSTGAVNQISELTMCAGDEDWYRIHLEPNEAVTAELGFDPFADLDLKLYPGDITDPNVAPLEISDTTQPREFIALRDFLGGEFLLRVHGHTQADITPYQLDLRVAPISGCSPDRIDQMNRGDTMADPFQEPFFVPFREADLTLCTTDDDWFRVLLPANFASYLRIHFIGADAVLDFELWQAGNFLFSSVGQPFPNHREVLVTIPGNLGAALAEVHVVRTVGLDGKYSFTHDLVPVFGCPDDPYEPNDTFDTASLAASSSTAPVLLSDATLCASVRDATDTGDVDWYVLNPPAAGARINASIEFTDGDLSMELFSQGAIARACNNFGPDRCYSDGNDLTEMVSFTATTTLPYLLRVSSVYSSPNVQVRPPNTDTPYILSVEYTP